MKNRIPIYLLAGVFLVHAVGVRSFGQSNEQEEAEESLRKLLDTRVTLSRRPEKAWETASATYIITQEDIHRSGATTIAEALRMAPGLDVARIDSSRWAISSRGFNDFFANKLLVLRDGRSLYTPLFSGVFWDVQDALLEDIDRIEVIRGPGASLWGANAVNGIINIVTKSAAETHGTLVSAGGGTEESAFGAIRYGARISDTADYRVYAKFSDYDDTPNRQENSPPFRGTKGGDEWNLWQTGFRTDWNPADTEHLRLQGDVYHGNTGQELFAIAAPGKFGLLPTPVALQGDGTVTGANLLGSWKHDFGDNSDLVVQTYYDRTEREDRIHQEVRDTFDLDAQHRFMVGERNQVMYGLGYRLTHDDLGDGLDRTGSITFHPEHRGDQVASAFVQDEITLIEDHLKFTAGSKFEHNDYTGFEIQPSGRLALTEQTGEIRHTIWGAVSRAVRTPSRFEDSIDGWFTANTVTNITPFGPLVSTNFTKLVGNPDFKSEEVMTYELGYRVQPLKNLSFDLTGFYNDYDNLRTVSAGSVTVVPLAPLHFYTVLPLQPRNDMTAETYGTEVAANWEPLAFWRLRGSYTFLKMNLHAPASLIPAEGAEGDSPENQFSIRSYLNLPYNLQWDTAVYYVESLSSRNVPSYTRLDMRLGWRPWAPKREIEFSVVVQNILDNKHPEFGSGFLVNPHEIERSVYGKVTWQF